MSNLCDGGTYAGPVPLRNSKAYAEGREAAAGGALIGTNPHQSGSEANATWDAGHASYAGGVGDPLPRDCAADTGYAGA